MAVTLSKLSKRTTNAAPMRRGASLPRRRSQSSAKKTGWKPLRLDGQIAFISLAFVLLGLIFTYSSSAFESMSYFYRQLIFDVIGLMAALLVSQLFDRILKIKLCKPIYLIYLTWIMLIIVLFSREQANVHRWIDLGVFKLQPSEIAKLTLVLYTADYLERTSGRLARNWRLLIPPGIVMGITLALILAEKDIGTPFLMGVVWLSMVLVAGAKFWHFLLPGLVLSPLLIQQLFFVSYRRQRILSFLNPFATEGSTGYQLVQSFLAVGSGGWFGKGFGNSELKMQYLPAAHTDFIFSIMCEEVGMFVILIIGGFCWLLVRGITLAGIAKTHFRGLVIFGLTLTISCQAFFNMAMAIGLTPTKGIALPFFSYGGSSVIMTLVMIGVILNMAALDNTQNNIREDITHYKNRNK